MTNSSIYIYIYIRVTRSLKVLVVQNLSSLKVQKLFLIFDIQNIDLKCQCIIVSLKDSCILFNITKVIY